MVVGEDFHFGHGRKGNVALLAEMGSVAGFEVDGVSLTSEASAQPAPAGVLDPDPLPGRRRRRGGSAALLGRPHQVRGPVVTGDRRGGAELGFPTANLAVPGSICLPAPGIYAGWYERPDGPVRPAASRWVGDRRSTVPRATCWWRRPPDFDGDLYGEPARLSFVHRLRDELAFDSVDALVAQMGPDGTAPGTCSTSPAGRRLPGVVRGRDGQGLGFFPRTLSTQAPNPVGFS